MKTITLPDLPKNWDALSSEQMVQLNTIRHKEGKSRENFLFHAFCYLLDLEVKEPTKDKDGQIAYLFTRKGYEDRFPMQPWEIQFFINEKLAWLTEDCTRLMDVFPTLILRGKTFVSPGYAMCGMTYQQHKKAQDFMVYYHQQTRRIISLMEKAKNGTDVTAEAKDLLESRKTTLCKFLATVYTPQSLVTQRVVDGQTILCEPPEKAAVFSPKQIDTYSEWFKELPEPQTDAIIQLFTGTMLNYQKMFPLLFPKEKENKNQSMNFIQIESSTMNALQDKLKFNNYQTIYDSNAPFILEKLHTILKEGKAIEEQNRKLKSKRK